MRTDDPQTAWTPNVHLNGSNVYPNGMPMFNDTNVTTSDGAGPVIWRVIKHIGTLDNHTQDSITVIFSEPILGGDGATFKASIAPGDVFTVWQKDSAGNWVTVDSVLAGITSFKSTSPNSVTFVMSNNQDLQSNQYLNIKVDTSSSGSTGAQQVVDRNGSNLPEMENQRVKVFIYPPPIAPLQAAPVPFTTSFSHSAQSLVLSGDVYEANYRNFRPWVRNEGTGTVFTFPVTASSDPADTITAKLFIYDIMGNLVNTAESKTNILPQAFRDSPGSSQNYDVYWNGTNARGMRVAPGVYRVVMYLKKKSGNQKISGTVGVR
jgi:hypothetical protein